MEALMVISTIIVAVATGVIAYYAFISHKLFQEEKSKSHKILQEEKAKENQYRQTTTDLFKAIVVSNIVSAPWGTQEDKGGKRLEKFKQFYDGETPIFKTE